MGVGGMSLTVTPDVRQPTTTVLGMGQAGATALPNRDYYPKDDPAWRRRARPSGPTSR